MSQRHLYLFGAPRIVAGGNRIALPRRKALALLAYLAATGAHHTREALAALLWGDSDEQSANAYLRNALWTLNKSLGADWSETDGGTVALNPEAVRVDIAAFGSLAAEAMHADVPERLKLSGHAIELYTGDFMAGFTVPDAPEFATWQTTTAESLRRTVIGVLMLRAEAARSAGDLFAATDAAQRWLNIDPLDERAARLMMQVLAEGGEVTAAVRQYHDLRRRLRESLSATPEPATTALFESLTARAPAPVAPRAEPAMAAVAATAPVSESAAALIRQTTEMMMPVVLDGEIEQTGLLGRDGERAALLDLLAAPDVRLVSIVAPGGMGKSILARQIGADAADRGLFADGVHWIALAPLCDADVVLSAIATALPYPLGSSPGLERRLHETLADKQALMILDNFEHVLEVAPVISRLLAAAPAVKAVVTSRERLNLRHERVFDLHGLAVPGPTDDLLRTTSDAAELFVRRAQQAAVGFTMTPQNAADIARICRMVEGMPLALELAASWTPLLSCAQIVEEIRSSLDFLTSPARDVPERHRSLRAVFASSWEQMTPDEQRVLAQLAVFRGGFRLEAAHAVAGASPRVLLSLVNKSLLKRRDDGRFEIHELLRQFAEGMLDPEARLDAVDKHIAYFAGLMHDEGERMLTREQRAALDVMQSEVDNVRGAWRHALARRKLDALDAMAEPLCLFCRVRSRFDDLPELMATAAEQLPSDTGFERALLAKMLIGAASLQIRVKHQAAIDAMVKRASDLLLAQPDRPGLGIWLVLAGALRRRPGRVQPEAEQLINLGRASLETQGELWRIGYGLFEQAVLQHMQVRYAEARETLNRAMYYFEKVGQPLGIALTLEMLAENMQTVGNYDAAMDYMRRMIVPYRELGMLSEVQRIEVNLHWLQERGGARPTIAALLQGLEEMQAAGDRRGAAWGTYNLAWLYYYDRNYDEAERLFLDCLRTFMALGDDEGIVWANIFLADLALESGRRAVMDTYIEGARVALADIDFPWGVSGLDYVIGNQALHDGDLEGARAAYRRAIVVANGAQSVMQVLRHMTGIADIWAFDEQPEDALVLATFIANHPTSWDDTRRRASAIVERLIGLLPPEESARLQAAGRALAYDDAVKLSLG